MKPKIAVITRMAYNNPFNTTDTDPDTPKWRYPKTKRLEVYENLYLKSLKNQNYKDFDVFIFVSGVRNQVGCEYNTNLIKQVDAAPLNIFYIDRSEFNENDYEIQLRIDSDDYVFPEFMEKCVEVYSENSNEEFVISFQPYIYDYNDKKLYRQGRRYSGRECSMFVALCQRGENRKFVCNYNHTKFENYFKNIIHLNKELCCLCFHGDNKSTNIKKRDKFIKEIEL